MNKMNPKQKRKKEKKVSAAGEGEDRKKFEFSPDNLWFKIPAYIAVFVGATVFATCALNKFLWSDGVLSNKGILTVDQYWYGLGAIAVIIIVGWLLKKIQLKSASIVMAIVVSIALIKVPADIVWRTVLEGNDAVPQGMVNDGVSVTNIAKLIKSRERVPDPKTNDDADTQKTNKTSGWQENHTFTNSGQFWATRHLVAPGDKVVIVVKYNSVVIDTGGGNLRSLEPGSHNWPITSGGVIAFISRAKNPAEIIVKKRPIKY